MSLSDYLAHLMDIDDEREIPDFSPEMKLTDGIVHHNMFRPLRTPYMA
jgi:hypothetical protein